MPAWLERSLSCLWGNSAYDFGNLLYEQICTELLGGEGGADAHALTERRVVGELERSLLKLGHRIAQESVDPVRNNLTLSSAVGHHRH